VHNRRKKSGGLRRDAGQEKGRPGRPSVPSPSKDLTGPIAHGKKKKKISKSLFGRNSRLPEPFPKHDRSSKFRFFSSIRNLELFKIKATLCERRRLGCHRVLFLGNNSRSAKNTEEKKINLKKRVRL